MLIINGAAGTFMLFSFLILNPDHEVSRMVLWQSPNLEFYQVILQPL